VGQNVAGPGTRQERDWSHWGHWFQFIRGCAAWSLSVAAFHQRCRRVAESVVSRTVLVPSMENCWAMWNFGSFNQLYLLVGMAESDVQTWHFWTSLSAWKNGSGLKGTQLWGSAISSWQRILPTTGVLLWSCPSTRSGDFGAETYEPIWAKYEPFSLCTFSEDTGAIHQKHVWSIVGIPVLQEKGSFEKSTGHGSPNWKLAMKGCRITVSRAVSTLCGAVQFWKMINDITPLGDSLTVRLKEIFHEAVELWSRGASIWVEVVVCGALLCRSSLNSWFESALYQPAMIYDTACPRYIMHGVTFPAVHTEDAGSCAQQAACGGLKWKKNPSICLLKLWSFLARKFPGAAVAFLN